MDDLQKKARMLVFDYVLKQTEGTPEQDLLTSLEQVRCSWFVKALGNWKALVITDLPDDMYYEVTHDGGRRVTFLDAYVKVENIEILDTTEQLLEQIADLPPQTLDESGNAED